MRLVITVPLDGITDGPGLADVLTSRVIPDLEAEARTVAAEVGELKPGQYGWTYEGQGEVRVHWAIRQEGAG